MKFDSYSTEIQPYEGLLFSFAEMEREIENLRLVAKPFLERTSYERVIPDWKRMLLTYKDIPPDLPQRWSISEDHPIETIISQGRYEPRGRKGDDVFGRISGTWEIKKPMIPKTKKGNVRNTFLLLGLASTQITIYSYEEQVAKEIARWTVEVGDNTSPGCHFHTQINLDETATMFPKSLPVPRIPAFLHTPMDALDFLLAEIFQEEWYQHTSHESDAVKAWARCQRHRLLRLLEWKQQKIKDVSGSPWTSFKRQKPMKDLFIS